MCGPKLLSFDIFAMERVRDLAAIVGVSEYPDLPRTRSFKDTGETFFIAKVPGKCTDGTFQSDDAVVLPDDDSDVDDDEGQALSRVLSDLLQPQLTELLSEEGNCDHPAILHTVPLATGQVYDGDDEERLPVSNSSLHLARAQGRRRPILSSASTGGFGQITWPEARLLSCFVQSEGLAESGKSVSTLAWEKVAKMYNDVVRRGSEGVRNLLLTVSSAKNMWESCKWLIQTKQMYKKAGMEGSNKALRNELRGSNSSSSCPHNAPLQAMDGAPLQPPTPASSSSLPSTTALPRPPSPQSQTLFYIFGCRRWCSGRVGWDGRLWSCVSHAGSGLSLTLQLRVGRQLQR